MINNRLKLQKMLLQYCKNVYFQPPPNNQLKYPAIVYSRSDIKSSNADDEKYITHAVYTITIIDKNPDSEILFKLLDIKHMTFDRQYASNNLNHFVLTYYD